MFVTFVFIWQHYYSLTEKYSELCMLIMLQGSRASDFIEQHVIQLCNVLLLRITA